MPTNDGEATSSTDPDSRPDRWHERNEKDALARAVIRELHAREEYKLARWAWEMHGGMGCIGPIELAEQEDRDSDAYKRWSIKRMADEFAEVSRAPENREAWADLRDAPMPHLRDPDAFDLWREADERYRYGSQGSDRLKVRAVCLRLWDLGLGPLAATTALHYAEDGPPVAEDIRSIPTLDEAVRVVADLWLEDPDAFGVTGYAGFTRTETRDVLEDY